MVGVVCVCVSPTGTNEKRFVCGWSMLHHILVGRESTA